MSRLISRFNCELTPSEFEFYNWLAKQDFEYWGTLTTRYTMSRWSARRMGNAFTKFAFNNHTVDASGVFWVAEPHKTGDFHLHWLGRSPQYNEVDSHDKWTAWNHISKVICGGARVETRAIKKPSEDVTSRDSDAVLRYVTKYITKRQHSDSVDWDITLGIEKHKDIIH